MVISLVPKRFVIEQLGELGLETEYAGHVQIGNLSGGQKVKVVLAAAAGKPHLIILMNLPIFG